MVGVWQLREPHTLRRAGTIVDENRKKSVEMGELLATTRLATATRVLSHSAHYRREVYGTVYSPAVQHDPPAALRMPWWLSTCR